MPVAGQVGLQIETYYRGYDSESLVQLDGTEDLRVRAVHEPDAKQIGPENEAAAVLLVLAA